MTPVKSSDCRAKDPSTCRFHGAVLRMEKAIAANDIESYIEARDEVDRLKQDPSNDFTARTEVPKSVTKDGKLDKEGKARLAYLKDTAAIPTPMEAYALWVSVYEAQGGIVKSYDSNYNSFGNVISSDPEVKAKNFDYASLAWNRWTPTKGNVPIPAGFGSQRLQLFILPDVVDQPLRKAENKRTPGRPDDRPGWEWGHTAVYILERTEEGGLRATTNQRSVTTYSDVDQYRRGKSVAELMGAFRKIQSNNESLEK